MIVPLSDSVTRLDLSPARWIWLPSERCLHNTFVLFRRALRLDAKPRSATGLLTADSRYRVTVNGRRVQWGPSPCDPRWQDVDPVDLTPYLEAGENVIGVEVCYFGAGDGTWPMGSPGFICRFDVEHKDGRCEQIVSDSSWLTHLDRAHRPGQYKRWFLRALQEEFDARRHPHGWDTPAFQPDSRWLRARELLGKANAPAIFAGGPEYVLACDQAADLSAELRRRTIPPMREFVVPALRMTEAGRVKWLRDPDDWFESRIPDSFEIVRDPNAVGAVPSANEGLFFTFEMPEQIVGFPRFTIDAPAGTIIELIVHESHDPVNGRAWLDTYIYHWTRFICREGVNEFETFDFESLKWIQLHVRGANRPVTIRDVGVRRRVYAWPNEPHVRSSEPTIQRLMDASVNTMHNSCQDQVAADGARERQQYSGDGSHQLHAIRYAFGETKLPARFLTTFSQGMTLDGYFLDCWPAFDRLARLMQRQIGATVWGPILDHGIGFVFDCWNHYMESGDLDALREPYPRLKRFAEYLATLRRDDGLLPVENIGVPTVWMDHHAYQLQSHKQCAFNLFTAAMLEHGLANIVAAFGDDPQMYKRWGTEIREATVAKFWDHSAQLFVVNPGESPRTCDRSLATAIMFDQCPNEQTQAALGTLVDCPESMGLSFPGNSVWRYWALAKGGRADVIVGDLRRRWATMNSVIHNNTLQENWESTLGSGDEFSHCPLAPLIMLYQCIAGIRATAPGFAHCEIRPQLGDLDDLDLVAHTPRGPIVFEAKRTVGQKHLIRIHVPEQCQAVVVVPGEQPRTIRNTIEFIG